jgi:hypothetical protein
VSAARHGTKESGVQSSMNLEFKQTFINAKSDIT